mmetsp:Transcript_65542/g.188568  ORF Transcript_65542/g.188568 Transcript_65542/m.188568 type:complete len:206 (+) Transcript_65542:38-655(+)
MIAAVCPWSDARGAPSDTPQTLAAPSEAPVARSEASGEKAKERTSELWPRSTWRQRPVAGSHTRAVMSDDAVAMYKPSGENAAALTIRECPHNQAGLETHWPVLRSQTFAAKSALPVTAKALSGEKDAADTNPVWTEVVDSHSPVDMLQARSVRSKLVVRTWALSGDTDTELRRPPWPSSSCWQWPFSASQTLAVRSAEPVTTTN